MTNRVKDYFTGLYRKSVERNRRKKMHCDDHLLAEDEAIDGFEIDDEGLTFTYYMKDDSIDEEFAIELEDALNDHRIHSDYIIDSLQLSTSGLEVLLKTWQTLNSLHSGISLYQGHRGCQGVEKCPSCKLMLKIALVINHACLMFENSIEQIDLESSEED